MHKSPMNLEAQPVLNTSGVNNNNCRNSRIWCFQKIHKCTERPQDDVHIYRITIFPKYGLYAYS